MFSCKFLSEILHLLPKQSMISIEPNNTLSQGYKLIIDNDEFDETNLYQVRIWIPKVENFSSKLNDSIMSVLKGFTYTTSDFQRLPRSYTIKSYNVETDVIIKLFDVIEFQGNIIKIIND